MLRAPPSPLHQRRPMTNRGAIFGERSPSRGCFRARRCGWPKYPKSSGQPRWRASSRESQTPFARRGTIRRAEATTSTIFSRAVAGAIARAFPPRCTASCSVSGQFIRSCRACNVRPGTRRRAKPNRNPDSRRCCCAFVDSREQSSERDEGLTGQAPLAQVSQSCETASSCSAGVESGSGPVERQRTKRHEKRGVSLMSTGACSIPSRNLVPRRGLEPPQSCDR